MGESPWTSALGSEQEQDGGEGSDDCSRFCARPSPLLPVPVTVLSSLLFCVLSFLIIEFVSLILLYFFSGPSCILLLFTSISFYTFICQLLQDYVQL